MLTLVCSNIACNLTGLCQPWSDYAFPRAPCRMPASDRPQSAPQGCELAVACHFLWAGRFRPREVQALGSASLFRISQASSSGRSFRMAGGTYGAQAAAHAA